MARTYNSIIAIVLLSFAGHFLMCNAVIQIKCSYTEPVKFERVRGHFIPGEKVKHEIVPAVNGNCIKPMGSPEDCNRICSGLTNSFEDETTKLRGICANDDEFPGLSLCTCCVAKNKPPLDDTLN
ncbi:hypothetical protein MKW94_007178 [Papaver nudicaule]|uniref:Uncharacterized protein n=1 Tax=Papaver nudicaule TaxID=74823 RepID=A0AA41VDT7_PAPNU|nr:hypothetical protein [Papaver nudicaule]